jgi:predicted Zn-dependent protease
MSHPEPAKRVRDVQQKIAQLGGMTSSANYEPPKREQFVRLLDGVITGNSTEHTVIRKGVIYDRGHGLVVNTPRGWIASVEPGVLFVMRPRGRNVNSYFVAQEIQANQLQGRDAQNAVRIRLEQMGLQFAGSRDARTQTGERFTVDVWQGQTQGGVVGVETTQFAHGDHVAVMMFVSPNISRAHSPMAEVFSQMSVNAQRARAAEPARINLGTVRSGETWADLARRATGNPAHAQTVAHINGFDTNTRPPAGMLVKLPQEVVEEE